MGPRARQVSLDKVKVALATPSDPREVPAPFDAADICSTYAYAFQKVFGKVAKVTLTPAIISRVNLAAAELGTRPDAYIFAVLHGHRVSCPERSFQPSFLITPSAAKRVIFYRTQAAKTYGVMDPDAVGRVAHDKQGLKDEMAVAEEIFGNWIIGERVNRGGNGLVSLYGNRETAFAPHWLVTESTYLRWMKEQAGGTVLQKQHRDLVTRIDPVSVAALAKLRGQSLLSVVGRAILRHGFDPKSLVMATPVTSAFKLWLGIGSALLQMRLIQGLEQGSLPDKSSQASYEKL